ncbi:MAG: CPP1-like family protein [Cyanobacteria bacterium J06627_28]
MSEQNVHYETLGLTEASSFEEVQSAKTRLSAEYKDDPQRKESIETAYDAILMERLRLRQEGKIKVPDRIRFAEKLSKPKSPTPIKSGLSNASGAQWLSDLLDQQESNSDRLWPSLIFAALIALSWLLASEDAVGASLTLALGMMATVYFLNQKTRRLLRAFGFGLAGLLVGVGLSLVIAQVLGSQGTVLPNNMLPSLSATVTLVVLWFVTVFLR